MKFSVTQYGKPLSKDKYTWDEETRTFSTNENNLVLDFFGIEEVNFNTGADCTFNTSSYCTFSTGSYCTFNTDSYCTFKTGFRCIFDTGSGCTFDTGSGCTFKTGSRCTFKTGSKCTFKTGSRCTFDTDYNCTFKTGSGCTFGIGHNCTFNTGSGCVIVRRDVFEIIQVPENTTIKLNDYQVKGYEIIKDTKTITIDGKEIEISIESFESLKEQLLEN